MVLRRGYLELPDGGSIWYHLTLWMNLDKHFPALAYNLNPWRREAATRLRRFCFTIRKNCSQIILIISIKIKCNQLTSDFFISLVSTMLVREERKLIAIRSFILSFNILNPNIFEGLCKTGKGEVY